MTNKDKKQKNSGISSVHGYLIKMITFDFPTIFLTVVFVVGIHAAFEAPEYWKTDGRRDLQRALKREQIYGVAKNTILMIGDGMGLPSITAGRIFKGQLKGQTGEEYKLSFEDFPNVALSKTYNVDRQVADSAGTASAIMSGIKANMGTFGVTSEVAYGPSCDTYTEARRVKTVLDYALEEGKSVGIVTTTRITHATPAAAYAHSPLRDWEDDSKMMGVSGCDNKVKDIAYQLIVENPNIQVILGGGRRGFENRKDNRTLIEEWAADKSSRGLKYASVKTKGGFDAVNPDTTDYLLGLFTSSHMSYELKRNSGSDGEPSLAEMAEKAIRILKKNPKGYFLLIEGGRIDHAHHDNLGKLALGDMVAFDDAVIKTKELTNIKDTLTVVTADHSHVFGIAGYPSRGNNILGTVDKFEDNEAPFDKMPYTTLTYSNGPSDNRVNYTNYDTTGNDFTQFAGIGMQWETHGGEEVAIYAQGPMSHMFHTTHEQSYIGHVIQYASCYGFYKNDCGLDERNKMAADAVCSANIGKEASLISILFVALSVILCSTKTFFDSL